MQVVHCSKGNQFIRIVLQVKAEKSGSRAIQLKSSTKKPSLGDSTGRRVASGVRTPAGTTTPGGKGRGGSRR